MTDTGPDPRIDPKAAHEWRKTVTRPHAPAVEAIAALLFQRDPASIATPYDPKEYEGEAQAIVIGLMGLSEVSTLEADRVVEDVFERWLPSSSLRCEDWDGLVTGVLDIWRRETT